MTDQVPEPFVQSLADNTLAQKGETVGSLGAWSAETTYAYGEVVTFAGSDWQSIAQGNLDNVPAGTSGLWTHLVQNTTLQNPGDWNYLHSYNSGDNVVYGVLVYTALQANQGVIPSDDEVNWDVATLTAYNSGTAYTKGNITKDGSGNVWVCVAHTTGNAPSGSDDYWYGTAATN